jgi:hypothetical protein
METFSAVQCNLQRHKAGVKVRIKVIPEVEEFFKQWGGGIEQAPLHGRLWSAVDGKPLKLWSFETEADGPFSLHKAGTKLIDNYDGPEIINISFLRLVGASEGNGREFIVECVMSTEEMEKIANKIVKAGEHFYLNYIRPVNISCYVGVVDYSKVPNVAE